MKNLVALINQNFQLLTFKLKRSLKCVDWLPFLPSLFYCYLYFDIFKSGVLLADDLSVVSAMLHNPVIGNLKSLSEAVLYYVSSTDASARPVPATLFSSFLYLIRHHLDLYYLLYVFFLISLFILYYIIRDIADKGMAFIITLIYSLIPIGTSLTFTCIMFGSSLASIFYCLSLYFVIKKKGLWLSALFFIISVFSYEVFMPLIVINFLLIDRKYFYRILYAGGIVAWIFLYRYSIQHYIFPASIHKEDLTKVLDFGRDIEIYKRWILLVPEFIKGLYKGLKGVRFFSLSDYLIGIGFTWVFCLIISKSKIAIEGSKIKILLLSLLGLFLANFIFIFSEYTPSLYSFDNRMLGAMRLAMSTLLAAVFFLMISGKILKPLLYICVVIFTATTISVKNGWIFSHQQNIILFDELRSKLPDNPLTNLVCIRYRNSKDWIVNNNLSDVTENDALGLYNNPQHIFNEPLFSRHTIASVLQERVGIDIHYQIIYYYTDSPHLLSVSHYIYDVSLDTLIYVPAKTTSSMYQRTV